MGYANNSRNILMCLGALDDALSRVKAPIKRGVAVTVDAARNKLAS